MTLAIFACWGTGLSRAFQEVMINTISSNITCNNLSAQHRIGVEWNSPLDSIGSQKTPSLSTCMNAGLGQRPSRLHRKLVSASTPTSDDSHIMLATTYAVQTTDVICVTTKRIKVESTRKVLRSQRTQRRKRTRTTGFRTGTDNRCGETQLTVASADR
jgi:hypothetical protein